MERYSRITSHTFNEGVSSPRRPTTISLPPKSYLRDPPPIPTYHTGSGATVIRRATAPVDDNTELSIFGAEKYFNDVVNTDVKKPVANHHQKIEILASPRDSSVSSADGYGGRGWRFYGTPTASSEASWNSRSGLLTNPKGSVAVSVRAFPPNEGKKSPAVTAPRWRFSWSCPCSGKKSADVEKKHLEPKTQLHSLDAVKTSSPLANGVAEIKLSPPKDLDGELSIKNDEMKLKIVAGSWAKEAEVFHTGSGRRCPFNNVPGGFSFPINPPVIKPSLEDPARDSLEVFRPSPKPRGGGGGGDDDVSSDASSDLFEIESFSTQCRRRDSLDELETRRSGVSALRLQRSIEEEVVAPSECCYPPSEVSVEWSVVTAEGFDRASVANFSSAASEFDELRYAGAEHDRLAAAVKRKAPTTSGGGLLTSCRCEKAVSVGPGPVRCIPEQRRPVAMALAAKHEKTPVLVRSYSGRVSRPPLSTR